MPMNDKNKFANKGASAGAAAAKGAAKKPPAKPKGFGELKPPRDPMPEIGPSRFRFVSAEEGFNPGTNATSYKVKVEALDLDGSPHTAGDCFTLVFMDTAPGKKDFQLCIAGFAGYEDVEEYNAFDPAGELPGAAIGWDNGMTPRAEELIGRIADVKVSRGGDCKDKEGNPTGDFYRRYQWFQVPDEDEAQDAHPRIE
jgi:hypothetical protein